MITVGHHERPYWTFHQKKPALCRQDEQLLPASALLEMRRYSWMLHFMQRQSGSLETTLVEARLEGEFREIKLEATYKDLEGSYSLLRLNIESFTNFVN